MAGIPLPQIGAKGTFVLRPPLEHLLTPNTAYECESVRSLGEIIRNGIEPFKKFYEPLGLTREYYNDLDKASAYIITLLADSGKAVNVPFELIESAPALTGIPYDAMVLSAYLGVIPQALPLDHIGAQVSNLIRDMLGTSPEIRFVKVSRTTYCGYEEHLQLEEARKAGLVSRPTDRARVVELEEALEKAQNENANLVQYIEANLT